MSEYYHNAEALDVLRSLQSSEKGLTEEEAKNRLETFLPALVQNRSIERIGLADHPGDGLIRPLDPARNIYEITRRCTPGQRCRIMMIRCEHITSTEFLKGHRYEHR